MLANLFRPIGWGTFYGSESDSQVYALLNRLFPNPEERPTFIFFDRACKLLAHIVTQYPESRDFSSMRGTTLTIGN